MEGKADYVPTRGQENKWHVIGKGDNPIHIMKKKDVEGLFSKEFYLILEVWQYFHFGFGFPDGKPWGEQDPGLCKMLMHLENHYKHNFSQISTIIELLRIR